VSGNVEQRSQDQQGDARTMLVRIKPTESKLGMFIHAFEGAFSDRPFWRCGFLLTQADDLGRLRRSSIDAVIIDTSKSQRIASPRPAIAAKKRTDSSSGLTSSKALDPTLKGLVQTVGRSKREVMKIVEDVRLGRPISVARLTPVIAELSAAVERNTAAFLGILRLKSRDEYTYLHSVAVSALMMNFARSLGLDATNISDLGMAGLLHDVGKISIPQDILNKVGALTADEFAVIKQHPLAGVKILKTGKGVPEAVFDVCLHHHERIDGAGYPVGMIAGQISMAARMGAICDVYDALTSQRPYKDAWSPQYALSQMLSWDGQFDAALLQTFLRSLGIYPVGTLVRLRDTSLCIVIAENSSDPTLPLVRSFFSIARRQRVRCEDLQIASPAALHLEDPADWPLENWPTLRRELLD
jgi:putative nucleotidyltransferase with HDIG domain